MEVKTMSVGLIGTNCYILSKDKKAIVVDPGGDADQILSYINHNELTPLAILLTHAHFDHIGALETVRKHTGVNTYMHEAEKDWLGDPKQNGSHKLPGMEISASPAEHYVEEGNLQLGEFEFEVIHTPGHSPGSVSFKCSDTKQIFSGDVLFQQGIGRTDLPGGDMDTLEQSIKNKLYQLDNNYKVYPGHGPATTIGNEKNNNPFFRSN